MICRYLINSNHSCAYPASSPFTSHPSRTLALFSAPSSEGKQRSRWAHDVVGPYNRMKKFVPLRNFIFDRLYHPTQGYFCKPSR